MSEPSKKKRKRIPKPEAPPRDMESTEQTEHDGFAGKSPKIIISRIPESKDFPKGRLLFRFRPANPILVHESFARDVPQATMAETYATAIESLRDKLDATIKDVNTYKSLVAARDAEIIEHRNRIHARNTEINTLRRRVSDLERVQRESGDTLAQQLAENQSLREELADSVAERAGVVSVDLLVSEEEDEHGWEE